MKLKKILGMILIVVLVTLNLLACNKNTQVNIEEANSQKIKSQEVDSQELNIQELFENNYAYYKAKIAAQELIPDFDSLVNLIKNNKEAAYKFKMDISAPFSAETMPDDKIAGKIDYKIDSFLANMGKVGTQEPYYLYKLDVDYDIKCVGSFIPSNISFFGKARAYLQIDQDVNNMVFIYKINEYEEKWHMYKINNIRNSKDLVNETINALNKQISQNNIQTDSESVYMDKMTAFSRELSTTWQDHYMKSIINSAKIINNKKSIDELNIKDAYEIQIDGNIIDKEMSEYIARELKEKFSDEGLDEKSLRFVSNILNQLVDKLKITETLFLVKGDKTKLKFGDYSIVKERVDFTNCVFNIDEKNDEEYFKAMLSFNTGEAELTVYDNFDIETIPEEVLDNSVLEEEMEFEKLFSSLTYITRY